MALEYLQTLLPKSDGKTTDDYQKQLQEYAQALMKSQSPRSKGVRYTWANGLNDATGSILGAMMLKRARDMELERQGQLPTGTSSGTSAPAGMLSSSPTVSAPGGVIPPSPLSGMTALPPYAWTANPSISTPSDSRDPWSNPIVYGSAT